MSKEEEKPEIGAALFAGHRQRGWLGGGSEREQCNLYAERMLYRALTSKNVVAFTGSGCSRPAGLPDWKGLVREVLKLAKASRPGRDLPERFGEIERTSEQLFEQAEPDPALLVYVLDEIQELFGSEAFGRFVQAAIPPSSKTSPSYERLLDLPIRRFVTTNYDDVLENQIRGRTGEEVESFHQAKPEGADTSKRWARFVAAFASPSMGTGNPYLVFHVHGKRENPESLIVTESDYREWYVTGRPKGSTELLQTLEVLWASNPILFVGFSLRDDDLLRPLRLLRATRGPTAPPRPLFAILPTHVRPGEVQREGKDWPPTEDELRVRQLERRYGIHITTFPCERGKEGEGLAEKLKNIGRNWERWKDSVREKPKFRSVPPPKASPDDPKCYYLYAAGKPYDHTLHLGKRLVKLLNGRPRIMGLVGPRGTGKSWVARYAMAGVSNGWGERMYWNTYHATDFVSFLDQALWLAKKSPRTDQSERDPPADTHKSRITDIVDSLSDRQDRQLLVIDRLERFMLRAGEGCDDRLIHAPLRYFLKQIFEAEKANVTVLLVSQLWPAELEQWGRAGRGFFDAVDGTPWEEGSREGGVGYWFVPPSAYLVREGPITSLPPDSSDRWPSAPDEISGLLRGNRFAEDVSRAIIASESHTKEELAQRLAWTQDDRRVGRVIREALYQREKTDDGGTRLVTNSPLVSLLRNASLLTSPITLPVLKAVHGEGAEALEPAAKHPVELLLEQAVSKNLVFKISEHDAYSLHPSVRSYFATMTANDPRERVIDSDALTPLLMPSVGRHVVSVEPYGEADVNAARTLLERLCSRAERLVLTGKDATTNGDGHADAGAIVRALVGALRGRMEPATASRWWTLDEYLRLMARVGNLTKILNRKRCAEDGDKDQGLWLAGKRVKPGAYEHAEGTLYAEEVLWLYSAIGLTYYMEGNIFDALLLFQEALETAVVIGGETGSGAHLTIARCNLGSAYRQYGSLSRAERHLREAQKTALHVEDNDHVGSVFLELAIIELLRGNLREARSCLKSARKNLDPDNLRGLSRLSYYRAEWWRARGDLRKAEDDLRNSRALAELGAYPDLIARCQIGQGHVFLDAGKLPEARAELQRAADGMKEKGVHSLVADAVCGLARVALRQGDAETARRHATESLALASEGLLGLRISSSLVVLGSACAACGMRDLGLAYLTKGKDLAERQGYATKKAEAERELNALASS